MSDSNFTVRFCSSFVASGIAEIITMPIDTTKVRLQVQNLSAIADAATKASSAASASKPTSSQQVYTGMFDAMVKITRSEGPGGLFKGLSAALLRQTSYTSLSMVLFPPIKNALGAGGSDPGFMRRLVAGGTAGAIGIALMNPTEVLKTQMQANRGPQRLRMRDIGRSIYQREGVLGFWSGVKPNIVRTFLVNAAELGTYDQAKHMLSQYAMFPDGSLSLHVASSGVAGFFSALTSTPADVIKTRLMNQAGHSHEYGGMLQALVAIPRKEGILSLYKGFVPILYRKLLWCTMFFVGYERLHSLLGAK